jgi:hypothetical protein
MDKKLLLIQAITLMFRESQLENNSLESGGIVRPIAESVALPDVSVGLMDNERDTLVGLKKICLDMCDNGQSRKFEAIDLMQKVKYICRDDDVLYAAFSQGVTDELDQEKLKRLCLSIRKNFKAYDEEIKVQEIIQKGAMRLKFNRDEIPNMHKFVQEMYSALEPYQSASGNEVDPAIISMASSDDPGSMAKAFKSSKELNDERGMFRTGWQGLNRMLQGGFRRGDAVVLGAMQHNFKTGFSLSLFKHLAVYNTPFMIDEKKKPMLLHISFENSLEMNLPFLYKNIFENKTGQQADLIGKTSEELETYVNQELQVNGYTVKFLHVNPSMWGYMDICNYVIWLETQGYEIHLLMVDYLNMIPKTGCDNTGPMGANVRDLFRRMRNFCAARKITFITPHQLSTEAKMLVRSGLEDTFVKEVANRGYYDGCKTVDNEVDIELYFHIVKAQDGKSYLTLQRGKHRGLATQTKAEFLYCVLAFEDIGDVRDDVLGQDLTRKKPGHGPMGSANATPFWDIEQAAA